MISIEFFNRLILQQNIKSFALLQSDCIYFVSNISLFDIADKNVLFVYQKIGRILYQDVFVDYTIPFGHIRFFKLNEYAQNMGQDGWSMPIKMKDDFDFGTLERLFNLKELW